MPLTLATAIAITPALETSRKNNHKNGNEKIASKMSDKERARFKEVQWKIEDSQKIMAERAFCGNERPLISPSDTLGDRLKRRETNTRKRYFNAVNQAWKSVLQPMSIYKEANLVRSVRNYKTMSNYEKRQPLTTVYVRWQGNEDSKTYTLNNIVEIFSHFGKIHKASLQTTCSALVTFETIESACRAINVKNIGVSGYPLHVCWLPQANQNARWVKKDSFPRPYDMLPELLSLGSSEAISHSNQIQCSFYRCPYRHVK